MKHKFDASKKSKLDNPKRREMLPPRETLVELGLETDARMADIGCGIGYFTLEAANIVGDKGYIYAMDVNKDMIFEAIKLVEENGIKNIEVMKNEEYNFIIPDRSVSFCLLAVLLHEIDDLHRFIKETKRVLSNGGTAAIVEWIKKPSSYGPPVDERLDESMLIALMEEEGFLIEKNFTIGQEFYALRAKKL